MIGSDKQCAWSDAVRYKKINEIRISIVESEFDTEEIYKAACRVRLYSDCAFWIESRDVEFNTEFIKSTYDQLKQEESKNSDDVEVIESIENKIVKVSVPKILETEFREKFSSFSKKQGIYILEAKKNFLRSEALSEQIESWKSQIKPNQTKK